MTPKAEQYSSQAYWNKRYAFGEECFDWYQRYQTLRHVIVPFVPRGEPVLQVGVGNSRLQLDMALDDYASVTSIDYSDVVIAQLQKAHAEHAELQYAVADARSMPEFADSSFASAIDKGTLDAMACGDKAFESIASMLREVSRVLKPGGAFVAISYGSPKTRMLCFTDPRLGWDPVMYTIAKPSHGNSAQPANTSALVDGPYTPEEALQMIEPVSDHLHYVYVCWKHRD